MPCKKRTALGILTLDQLPHKAAIECAPARSVLLRALEIHQRSINRFGKMQRTAGLRNDAGDVKRSRLARDTRGTLTTRGGEILHR
ncbi:hypothetical protein FM119_11875 [Mycetocola reblochoni REB411]|uniref:Uncharacterized protein n=1 Tax=Mycetocola reblochoni REB411 TaxID=1255698 RepID=A0A1R4K8G6_9MICO|nr:hypothetical protein FM119_11875 [Mycetocola reblochoni REB411]